MVGPRVYHLKHARSYPAFTTHDPAKIMDLATNWLARYGFHVKRKNRQYSRGSKRGIHVNFVPKFKLYIEQGTNGQYVVRFDYYAKIKIGTAVVVGVLTSGISTVVGVGTLAVTLADADHFVDKFWGHIDSLARGNPIILTVERWASDGKGNFVQQPAPGGPVAVGAMPGHPVDPTLVRQQSQSHAANVVPSSQLPHPAHMAHPSHMDSSHSSHMAHPSHMDHSSHTTHPSQMPHQAHAMHPSHPQGQHYMPDNGQWGAPMLQQQPPPPIYYPPLPPPAQQQVAPPNIQPGQVFGHNALLTTQTVRSSAPPPPPPSAHMVYPNTEGLPLGNNAPTNQPQNSFAPSHHAQYPPNVQSTYPPPHENYPTTHNNLPTTHNNLPPTMSHNGNPPPLPPKNISHPHTSQHNYPAPVNSQYHQPQAAPQAFQPNLPAPINSQHSRPASIMSQQNYPQPSTSQRSMPPPAPSHGYPSPPSVYGSHRPSEPQIAYPTAPAPQLYPSAPSIAGSVSGFDDAASRRGDDVSQNRRSTSQVGSHAKNVNRISQYDLQGSFPIGENKSVVNSSSSFHDFNYADTQSVKSSTTYNPWDSNALLTTRNESLQQKDNLYPQLGQTSSGLAKH